MNRNVLRYLSTKDPKGEFEQIAIYNIPFLYALLYQITNPFLYKVMSYLHKELLLYPVTGKIFQVNYICIICYIIYTYKCIIYAEFNIVFYIAFI